jgi:hypothetical protein
MTRDVMSTPTSNTQSMPDLTSPVFADRTGFFFFIFHAVCVSSQNSIEKFGKPTLMGIPVQCNPNGNRHFFPSNLWKPIAN